MNPGAILKVSGDRRDGGDIPRSSDWSRERRGAAAGIALWAFMGVATALFSLFIVAYALRMDSADWYPIAMPRQLWLSTALLAAGSVFLHRATRAALGARGDQIRILLLAGGLCALGFLAVQLWAWQALLALRVMPVGNPAGSFFYLLTAMHGLHVAGGLAGLAVTMRRVWRGQAQDAACFIALCARYWHFLLAVWVVLFASLGWLTPDMVRYICGTG
jgi:cytochrome c oxidase subunit 3